MVKRLPVVAAIPNFNMAENLRNLIPQILAQRYDGVFVLDDASTDHSVDVVRDYRGEVRWCGARKTGVPALTVIR